MDSSETQDLARRLAAAEAQLKQAHRTLSTLALGLALTILATVVGLGLVYLRAKRVPRQLHVESLMIKDSAGTPRIWLGSNKEGVGIAVMGDDGNARFWTGLNNGVPSLSVTDAGGKSAIAMGVAGGSREPYLVVKTDDKIRVSTGVTNNQPYLTLKDPSGKPVFKQP